MALLTRVQIDAATDLVHEDVHVPEWGGEVRLRALMSRERSAIEATMIASKGQKPEFRAEALKTLRERTVAAALIDAEGKRLYSDKEVNILAQKSGEVIERLFQKAQELSGMDKNAVDRAEGNSGPAQSGSSGSD